MYPRLLNLVHTAVDLLECCYSCSRVSWAVYITKVLKVVTMYWPKTQFSTIFGPFLAQKRLRNGYINGWETLERTASTLSSCDERLWGVSFAPGQASGRVSRARMVVPLGNHGRRWPRITSISDFQFDRFFLKIGKIKICTPLVPMPLQNKIKIKINNRYSNNIVYKLLVCICAYSEWKSASCSNPRCNHDLNEWAK